MKHEVARENSARLPAFAHQYIFLLLIFMGFSIHSLRIPNQTARGQSSRMTGLFLLVNLWFLALCTVHAIPLQSTSNSAPALRLIQASTLAVEPLPICTTPESSRPEAAIVLADCLIVLFFYLLDPVVRVPKKRNSSTPVSVEKEHSCGMGVIPAPRAADLTSRFSLLDEVIAGAIIVRQCVEDITVNAGGQLYVGRDQNWIQNVFNPEHTPSRPQVAASSALANLPPPSSNLALLSSFNFSVSSAEPVSARRVKCTGGLPKINGADCFYMFYDLLAKPGVSKFQRWGGGGPLRAVFRQGRCLMMLEETSKTSIDGFSVSDIIIAAASVLYQCTMSSLVRFEGGQTFVGVREQFILTLSGQEVVGSASVNANQTSLMAVGDVASS